MIKSILQIFEKLFRLLKEIWPLVIIALAVFVPGFAAFLGTVWTAMSAWVGTAWAAISGFAAAHGWLTTAAIALGAVAIVSPSTAETIVERVGDVVRDVGETAGEVVGGVAGSVFDSITSSPIILVAIAAWFLTRSKRSEAKTEARAFYLPPPDRRDQNARAT